MTPVEALDSKAPNACSWMAVKIMAELETLRLKQEEKTAQQISAKKKVDEVDKERGVAGKLVFPESKQKNICKLEIDPMDAAQKIVYGLFVYSKGKGVSMNKFAGFAIGDTEEQVLDGCETVNGVEKLRYKPGLSFERNLATNSIEMQGLRVGYLDKFICVFE